jgi:prophage DNA circulation protein
MQRAKIKSISSISSDALVELDQNRLIKTEIELEYLMPKMELTILLYPSSFTKEKLSLKVFEPPPSQ